MEYLLISSRGLVPIAGALLPRLAEVVSHGLRLRVRRPLLKLGVAKCHGRSPLYGKVRLLLLNLCARLSARI